ncbi:response regulator [Sandarakinorhabdus sp. DWP1-3-1]|uniref:response regulator n=1 Tax=Sandarakinorhabdus sp. DWP1-3-1 TaxID=2804627 RepID=UPI003CF44932
MRSCLICDDHAMVRDALAALVGSRWPDAEIRHAASFPEAWSLAAAGPDICLVDLVMPGADERAGVAGIRAAAPGARVIIITGTQDDALLLDLIESGVDGFVPKACDSALLLAAIELVAAGGRYLPPRIAHIATERRGGDNRTVSATPRQREVLLLISQGLSNKAIAKRLGLSPATVKTHVAVAIATVGAANRTEAAMKATLAGLI